MDVSVCPEEVEELARVCQPEGEGGGVGVGGAEEAHLAHPGAQLGEEVGQPDRPAGGSQLRPVQGARPEPRDNTLNIVQSLKCSRTLS